MFLIAFVLLAECWRVNMEYCRLFKIPTYCKILLIFISTYVTLHSSKCFGLQSALHPHSVRLLAEGDDTRGCGDTIGPPDDEQRAARNMLRSVV